MKVKDLQEYLKNFAPGNEVVIWEWGNPNPGDNTFVAQIACNYEYQKDKKVVILTRAFLAPITLNKS